MNIKTLKAALPYIFEARLATMITGHHGVGKSQAVKQYADEHDMQFVDLRLGTQDVGDLLGLADFIEQPFTRTIDGKDVTVMEKVATKFMRPDWFPEDPNSKGIIFLDEVNRGTRPVLQAIFQLVLDHRLHRYELPKAWKVIAAMNPSTADYIVTDISDKAFMDRFCHIKLSPSKQEFFTYAEGKKFNTDLLAFLKNQPDLLQGELEDFSLEVSPSRRSWDAVNRLLEAEVNNQKAPQFILQELARGLVGTKAATALIKALNSKEKPITGEEVLKDYTKVQKRVQKYKDPKTNRLDAIKFTCDSLEQLITERTKKLTDKEAKNLSDFLWDIPRDLSFDLCRELYMQEITRTVIDENIELLSDMADKRGIKVNGLNDKKSK